MRRHTLISMLLLGLGLGVASCSKSAEAPEKEAAAEPEKPEGPKPGDMILVPAGEFTFGSNEKTSGRPALEAPERRIKLPAFYIDAYEVNYEQWMKFTIESDYEPEGNWRQFYSIGKENYPVTNVTWEDAKAYCKWAGKRLPTEAEWEKAARGPDGNKYPWGDKWDPTKSNCNELGYRNTVEVGQIHTDVSAYGVHDMMGNAQEWTSEKLKPYPRSPARRDPLFRRGYVVVRGGSYAMKGGSMALWTRSGYFPKSQYGIGFRCAKDAPEEESAEPAAEPSKK